VVLNDSRFERIDQDGIHLRGHLHQLRLVHQKPLRAIVDSEDIPSQPLEIHADARAQPAEQHSSWSQNAPKLLKHSEEVSFVPREVKDGAADHNIGKVIGKIHLLNRAYAKVSRGQAWGKLRSQGLHVRHTFRICIDCEDFTSLPQ
jgi:hypothetical protein